MDLLSHSKFGSREFGRQGNRRRILVCKIIDILWYFGFSLYYRDEIQECLVSVVAIKASVFLGANIASCWDLV